MATSVTLKESDGTEIYPVTDISLVNGGIHAVDIQTVSPAPSVTSDMIDWSTIGTPISLEGLGTPPKLTVITNHSVLVGNRFFVVNVVAKITTANSSYTQIGLFDLPLHVGYDAPLAAMLESGGSVRYSYVEANSDKLIIATGAAVSDANVRITGVIPIG